MNTRPRLLAVCALALSCLVAACGQSTGASNLTVPQDEKLYVFDGSSSDAMRLLVFHPGGDALLTLPGGVVSLDLTRPYHTETSDDRTTITLYDTRSGATIRAFDIAGSYTTATAGFAVSIAARSKPSTGSNLAASTWCGSGCPASGRRWMGATRRQ